MIDLGKVSNLQRFIVALLLLATCDIASGQSVTLPTQVSGMPGQWIIVAPITVDGGVVKWRIDPALQEVNLGGLLPPEFVAKLRGKVVSSGVPGRYKVEAWNAKGDEASEIATTFVVISGPLPPPVPPLPPVPPSPLQASLQNAYASDTDAQKATNVQTLAALMDAVVGQVQASGKVKTDADFAAIVKSSTDIAIGPLSLKQTRAAIGAYLNSKLPRNVVPVTPEFWATAAVEYANVATALKGVK